MQTAFLPRCLQEHTLGAPHRLDSESHLGPAACACRVSSLALSDINTELFALNSAHTYSRVDDVSRHIHHLDVVRRVGCLKPIFPSNPKSQKSAK